MRKLGFLMPDVNETQLLEHGPLTVKTLSVKILNIREHERIEASL